MITESKSQYFTMNQINAIKCAYLDLKGALEAFQASDMHQHDWTAHQDSIDELVESFDFIKQLESEASEGEA